MPAAKVAEKAPVMSAMARRLTSNATHAPQSMLSKFTVTSHELSSGKRPWTPAREKGKSVKRANQNKGERQKNMLACVMGYRGA